MLGVVITMLFFAYILTTQFVAKKYLFNNSFYMDGIYYRLERVR
jgi:hypothetical protein